MYKMLSRVLPIFALAAVAVALPANDRPILHPITTITDAEFDRPWFEFPIFGNMFAPLWKLFPSFADIGPRIEADDDNFKVIVNVKGYKKEDLKVKVKGDFIFVQGAHEAKQDDSDLFTSQFFHTYTLPANASGDDVTATYSTDEFLVVNCPLAGTGNRGKIDKEVQIEATGVPYKEVKVEEKPENVDIEKVDDEKAGPATTEGTTIADDDDRREPTTAADREEVTEKDNVIPHGELSDSEANEVQP